MYVATGNPDPDNTGNFGESVLKFDSTAAMHRTGAFKTFPGGDNDISSVAPSILPNNMIFQIGKQQTGFLIDTTNMTQLQSLHMCNGVEAFGANAFDGSHLFVPCSNHIQEVNVDVAHRTMSLGWAGPGVGAAGSPILAGGSLWTIDRVVGDAVRAEPGERRGARDDLGRPRRALRRARRPRSGWSSCRRCRGSPRSPGPPGVPPHAPERVRERRADHTGYWVAGSDGNVFPFGSAPSCGSLAGVPLAQPIVGMAGRSTPATGWSPATAASSRSVTRSSTARPAASA